MPKTVPESTSAEAIDRYVFGRRISAGTGPAWEDVKLSIMALPPVAETFKMPATVEPMIVWTRSGESEASEREGDGPWLTRRIKAGSLYLTAAGAPYDFRWRSLGDEALEVGLVLLSLPLFKEALAEVYGTDAEHARLRDVSGFEDEALVCWMEQLREESVRPSASRLLVRGIGLAVAVHLARHYSELVDVAARGESSALPGFKLRRITDWMAANLAEEFSLARLAEQAGLSEFHFNRLFKRATGLPPSRYQIKLRLDAAKRLLRETSLSVITIANDVGYSSPSHFAQLFRKETGLSPSDYRRQR